MHSFDERDIDRLLGTHAVLGILVVETATVVHLDVVTGLREVGPVAGGKNSAFDTHFE